MTATTYPPNQRQIRNRHTNDQQRAPNVAPLTYNTNDCKPNDCRPKDNKSGISLPNNNDDASTAAESVKQVVVGSTKLINVVSRDVNRTLLKININLNGTVQSAVVDSGATYSMISTSLVEKLGLNVENSEVNLRVLGNEIVNTSGVVRCTVAFNNTQLNDTTFRVFPKNVIQQNDLFLGVDFMLDNSIELRLKDSIIVKHFENNGFVEFHVGSDGTISHSLYGNINCYSTKDQLVQKDGVCKLSINFHVPLNEGNDLFMYDDNTEISESRTNSQFRGLAGIFDQRNTHVLCMAADASSRVKKGQKLGTISSVVEIPTQPESHQSEVNPNVMLDCVQLPNLNNAEQRQVMKVLGDRGDVFSVGEFDIGSANVTQHVIKLSDDTPIFQRPRRFSPPVNSEIERQCDELHSLDVIEPSLSPWNSPIVPITKKGGGLRMCLDYRKLNKVTVPDRHPMPNMIDSLFGLNGTKYFASLDLRKSYYQVPIHPNSRKYTAFATSKNHWQFKRLSFGLRNAPAAFQREIQAVLSPFPSSKVIAYIDDILIMGRTFEEHLNLVSKVLETLCKYKLKLNLDKCEFFRTQVKFLGHIVSTSGIKKTPGYVQDVKDFPKPTTKGEMREFIGLINFQRKYVPNCSLLQRPLTSQMTGKRSTQLEWTDEMDKAFVLPSHGSI